MKNLLLVLTLSFVFASTAHAWKGMGGGGGDAAGGTTFDLDEAKSLTPMDKMELFELVRKQIPNRWSELPQLKYLLQAPLTSKFWNLSSVALNPACQNKSLAAGTPDVIGCQTTLEVRISETWWKKASERERAAIVVHEALLAYFEDTPFDSDAVRPIVASLFSNQPAQLVREAFRLSSFGFLALDTDLATLSRFVNEATREFCAGGRVTKAATWIAREPAYLNDVVFEIRSRMEGLHAVDAKNFCSQKAESDEKSLLVRWMRSNPLWLQWLDRKIRQPGGDVEAQRIWLLLVAI